LQWINRLPDELVRGSVSLSIFYSWTLLLSGEHPQDARSYLDEITPENKHVNSQLNAVKSMLAMYQRKYPAAATLARQAMEDLPESDLFFRNIAAWNLSASLYMSGDKKGGEEVLEEVTRVSLESGNRLVAVISLCRLGLSRMQEGELFKPRELFQQALDLAIDSRGEPLPVASEAMIGLGTVHWQWNDLDTASHYLLEAAELSKRWREQSTINGYVALAHLSQSQEEVDLSDKMLEKARQIAARSTATELDDHYVASQQAHLWIRRGDLHAAGRWAAELGLDEYLNKGELPTTKNIGADLLRRYELIVYVRLLTAENRASEALVLLDLLLPFMEQMGILGKIIEIHILQTIGLQSQGKIDEAVTASATALTLAGPEEHLRPFLDEGPSLVVTLKRIAAQGVEADFAQRILKLLSDSKPGSVAQVKTTELAEPLSDRELEILFLLETDLTVPEMAEKLYIAVSTVRSHIKSIYGKLGVHSRFEAVSRAEDFGLL
jgi:LuxR family maltose regulon positive regulatory protein